jgi:hypothetical protein
MGNEDMIDVPIVNQTHNGVYIVKIRSMLKEAAQIEMRVSKISKTLISYVTTCICDLSTRIRAKSVNVDMTNRCMFKVGTRIS